VKSFFEKNLNFKGELKGLNGKEFLELTEKEIKKLNLNLGQRKRLIKYANYFKTIKNKQTGNLEKELKIIRLIRLLIKKRKLKVKSLRIMF